MIKKPLDGFEQKEYLRAKALDKINFFILADGAVRGAILHGTMLLKEMRNNHNLGILESYILGHAYMAAGLLTVNVKGEDTIGFSINCDGPIGGLSVEANAHGDIRGYMFNDSIPLDKPLERFDMAPFIGNGTMTVTKVIEKAKTPFSGQISLVYSSVARDLANYFYTSEQIPSSVSLSVQYDKTGAIVGAGGVFLQALPGTKPSVLDEVTTCVEQADSLGQFYAGGGASSKYVRDTFNAFDIEFLGSKRIDFFCTCNKNRFSAFISELEKKELEDLKEKQGYPLRVKCHNCGSVYEFDEQEIKGLIS